jgi:hypothetical protein
MTVITASVAASLLIAGSVFAVRSLDRSAVVPAPPAPAGPISKHWMLKHSLGISHVYATRAWDDPPDTSIPGVDMTRLEYGRSYQPRWDLLVAGHPPHDRTRADVYSYGLVLDTTQDGVPDYLVGIEDDPTPPSDFAPEYDLSPREIFRVWVTDLATGKTDEQIGPPYGYPIEFGTPHGRWPEMWFTFLGNEPDDMHFRSVRFYAWASLTSDGEIVAHDVAPDDGWMTIGTAR